MFQSPKRLRMDDPISVVLEGWTKRTFLLKKLAALVMELNVAKGERIFFSCVSNCSLIVLSIDRLHLIEYALDR